MLGRTDFGDFSNTCNVDTGDNKENAPFFAPSNVDMAATAAPMRKRPMLQPTTGFSSTTSAPSMIMTPTNFSRCFSSPFMEADDTKANMGELYLLFLNDLLHSRLVT